MTGDRVSLSTESGFGAEVGDGVGLVLADCVQAGPVVERVLDPVHFLGMPAAAGTVVFERGRRSVTASRTSVPGDGKRPAASSAGFVRNFPPSMLSGTMSCSIPVGDTTATA